MGIRPRNVQQIMGLELLLREDIPLVTLTGKAGTGKTLLALASGLMQTEDLGLYKNYLWQDQLFQSEKISVIYQEKRRKVKTMDATNFDNLEYLFNTKKPGELDAILAGMGSIEVEALTYIRGRSIPISSLSLTKHKI